MQKMIDKSGMSPRKALSHGYNENGRDGPGSTASAPAPPTIRQKDAATDKLAASLARIEGPTPSKSTAAPTPSLMQDATAAQTLRDKLNNQQKPVPQTKPLPQGPGPMQKFGGVPLKDGAGSKAAPSDAPYQEKGYYQTGR